MRYALIDNSTLTSIQRLLGDIPVRSKAIIDNDIVAFENYIQAILFYDSLICIDDYKPSFRKNRIGFFPDVKFISKNIFPYDKLQDVSKKVTDDILLEIKGGKITDEDFKSYFERLQMTFQFTWDMASSSFFLTQKMLLGESILDINKFSVLHSAIFRENNEQYEVTETLNNKQPKLYDYRGYPINYNLESGAVHYGDGNGLSPQLRAMIASLNWLSQRTAFYVMCADYLMADLFIQPLRQSFLQNIIKRAYPQYNLGVFDGLRSSINKQSQDSLKKILSTAENFDLTFDIPLFSAFFAKKTLDSKKIIEAACNERDKKCFLEARNGLRELNGYLAEGNRQKFIKEINLLKSSLQKSFEQMESKYGIGSNQGVGFSTIKFLSSFIPLVKDVQLPDWDIRIKQLEFLKDIKPRKGFNAVYRNLIEDLVEFDQIGKYKDILLKNVNFAEGAEFYTIKTEDVKYVRASSHWKRRM